MSKPALLQMFPQELSQYLKDIGQPAYRAAQLFHWLHKGVGFNNMSNLPLALREELNELAVDLPARIIERFESDKDGTVKLLFAMLDGHCVEGVLMHYRYGVTLCLSTQVGCRMGCSFCASTLEGLARNLSAAEMMHMVLLANGELGEEKVHNIVLMGSGEPLDNYDEVVRFLRLVSHEEGLNIGLRHISLSTCGLANQIDRLAEEGLPVTLSVSLHAPNDEIRQQTMPVARSVAFKDLLASCRNYISKTGRRVVFEYALVDGLNNLPEHARELAGRLRGMQCHVNLIPLNPVKERSLQSVTKKQAEGFLRELEKLNISVSLRREMGEDIAGACGQLRRRYLKQGAALSLEKNEIPQKE
ncbi:MAG: 23S rRNA (adenine(2503)-C(2))-methyltransferase RlmN [Clostridiales bacterium]|nr:23S rRNA (adenine(2503)-C(2))-methyltransferase RlmN [Clostridiales bacterium]